jgi:acetyl esterase/lipase
MDLTMIIRKKDGSIKESQEWIDLKNGTDMRLCIYRPKKQVKNVPGILWLHGGGYATGIPEQAMKIAKIFIQARDCIVVAPDYRLSLQAPYPAALEDSYRTLLWMRENAERLGIDESKFIVGGNSAGGGLTAALSLYARDKKDVNIAFQLPLYPMLDDRMLEESAIENNAPVWNSKSNLNAWKLYLGDRFGASDVPEYAAPARAKDFSGLPPAVTFVGDLDPFRDETIRYVKNLRKAGVRVDFKIFKGCYHGFDQICPKADISKKAISFVEKSFKKAVDSL